MNKRIVFALALAACSSPKQDAKPDAGQGSNMPDAANADGPGDAAAVCMPQASVSSVEQLTCPQALGYVTLNTSVRQTFRVPKTGFLSGIEIVASGSSGVLDVQGLQLSLFEESSPDQWQLLAAVSHSKAQLAGSTCPLQTGASTGVAYFALDPGAGGTASCVPVNAAKRYRFELTGGNSCVNNTCSGTNQFCDPNGLPCPWFVGVINSDVYASGEATLVMLSNQSEQPLGDLAFKVLMSP